MIKILSDKEYKEILAEQQKTKAIQQQIDILTKEYASLLENQQKSPVNSMDYAQRLADLEVKMAKLWALLLETTPTGKDKLTKMGKFFGGKSKNML